MLNICYIGVAISDTLIMYLLCTYTMFLYKFVLKYLWHFTEMLDIN